VRGIRAVLAAAVVLPVTRVGEAQHGAAGGGVDRVEHRDVARQVRGVAPERSVEAGVGGAGLARGWDSDTAVRGRARRGQNALQDVAGRVRSADLAGVAEVLEHLRDGVQDRRHGVAALVGTVHDRAVEDHVRREQLARSREVFCLDRRAKALGRAPECRPPD